MMIVLRFHKEQSAGMRRRKRLRAVRFLWVSLPAHQWVADLVAEERELPGLGERGGLRGEAHGGGLLERHAEGHVEREAHRARLRAVGVAPEADVHLRVSRGREGVRQFGVCPWESVGEGVRPLGGSVGVRWGVRRGSACPRAP